MRRGLLVLALTLLPVAGASTSESCTYGGDAELCIIEENTEAGSCETRDYHSTKIRLRTSDGTWFEAHGWEVCEPQGWEPGSYSSRYLVIRGVFGEIAWHQSTTPSRDDCSLAYYSLVTLYQPCPIGPPNPGWGQLVPWETLP